MATDYGSAQVGHLYFFGSALQTPQRTSDIVLLVDGGRNFKSRKEKTNVCRGKGCAGSVEDDVRNTLATFALQDAFPIGLNPAANFHCSSLRRGFLHWLVR